MLMNNELFIPLGKPIFNLSHRYEWKTQLIGKQEKMLLPSSNVPNPVYVQKCQPSENNTSVVNNVS
jgi:hypothetical protein